MPKAKPTQVIVHRIELQETERATLEAALAGNFVTNAVGSVGSVFTGIGNMLVPFGGALTAIAGLWLADKTLDTVLDEVRERGEKTKERLEESYHDAGSTYMSYFASWLNSKFAEGGWDAVCEGRVEYASDYYSFNPVRAIMGPQWFFDICMSFLESVCDPNNVMARNSEPVELWGEWYSIDQYGKDAYYYTQQEVKKGFPWLKYVGL